MDPYLEAVRELGADAAVALSCLLLAVSGYKLTPSVSRWIDARTRLLTEKNAKQAERFVRRVNGTMKELSQVDIERNLKNSSWFQQEVVDARVDHKMKAVLNDVERFRGELWNRSREIGNVSDRVTTLEAEVRGVKEDVTEIKDTVRDAVMRVSQEAKEIRREMSEQSVELMRAVHRLADRRNSPREGS